MKTEELEKYVGTYSIHANYHKKYHYYFGNTKVISDETLIKRTFTLEIKEDATVLVTYTDRETITGKCSTTKDKIKFKNNNQIG